MALEPIKALIEEGIEGTRHAGVHLIVMDATTGTIIFETDFGYEGKRHVRLFRAIALEKANLIREHNCSINEMRRTVPHILEQRELHNGGVIEDNIIVTAAGAGPIGNVLIVRPARERSPSDREHAPGRMTPSPLLDHRSGLAS